MVISVEFYMYLLKQGTFENQKMFQYAAIMCAVYMYKSLKYMQVYT